VPISYSKRSTAKGRDMNSDWIRYRTSALLIGSFLVFDIVMYATTHFWAWLLLAAFGIVRLAIIGWAVFGDRGSGNSYPQGTARLAQPAPQAWPQQQPQTNWQQPIPPAAPMQTTPAAPAAPASPVPPPPPAPGFYPPAQPQQPPSDTAPWNI
jgi:hypothetical protein